MSELIKGTNAPDEICVNCQFYDVYMKQYNVPRILKTNPEAVYVEGKKFCIKNKDFVYFNDTCTHFTKRR